jgi:restriction system protein
LAGKPVEVVDELEEEIESQGEDVAARAKEFTKDKIQALSWEEMQELVAGLLRAMGYKTKVSPVGPDRGKDIVASPDGLGLEDPKIHVEVKHRKGAMGANEIRSFAGGLRKTKGLYVSTGGFTREAHYEAERSDTPITLMDIDELARMIVRYYDNFDTEARDLLPLKKIYWPI